MSTSTEKFKEGNNMQCVTCGKDARDTPWPTYWQMLKQLKSEGWNTTYKVCTECADKIRNWKEPGKLRLRRRRAKGN